MIDQSNIDPVVLKLATETFGHEGQFDQTQEECAELIVAINHYRRGRITPVELASEIADVLIMCHQVSSMIGDNFVDQQVRFKHSRLIDRIKDARGIFTPV